ncbi:MAG: hypothetical protein J07HQW1_02354 [Haloquadratum walsbyi J07HQW1]|jgi:hypothetical protein|uniref:Uncharacterized protein n=1 Tax=Haloquadratum walsbyi J07HQW1 TaxID=1238424 RepID=U1N767_9EURY|nr:MAG: hypothetical protein J07HQW1_02354 [Haloquadratum walsbyi J07HQW1]
MLAFDSQTQTDSFESTSDVYYPLKTIRSDDVTVFQKE